MAKFYGKVGYAVQVETADGVWTNSVTEREVSGEVIKNTRRLVPGDRVNDNLEVSNSFSILADPYASQNFHAMLYLEWMGTLWKITTVEVQRPRLILTIGGVYNGK